jgi:protein MYSM1
MFRDNIPLPPKVKETGDGYTLSGKPLDPNSAAAKPYLKSMTANKIDKVERQTKELKIAENKSL